MSEIDPPEFCKSSIAANTCHEVRHVGTAWQDQYGNLCHTLTVAEPVSELEIKVYGLVRTRDTNGVVGMTPSELPSSIYLRETPHTVVRGQSRTLPRASGSSARTT